jgi:hypothetical protein
LQRGGRRMRGRRFASIVIAGMAPLFASTAWADIPAPPVEQTIGMLDVAAGAFPEAECRVCHDSGVPDRHHGLYGQPIPDPSLVPFPDADGDGIDDTIYVCLSCHDQNFTVVRDCVTCHTSSAHHTTPAAVAGDCVSCHGDLVDNMGDGHYIPAYAPSLVTPYRSGGVGPPPNSRGSGAGACNYCHDDDGGATPPILTNQDLHHNTGLSDCSWCHDFGAAFEEQIRTCEGCHGPDSLHNIQADSLDPDNIGTIVVGAEEAGYGHVGRDAGPGDSDCWGCHGFGTAFAPGSGPIIPTVYTADRSVIDAGADTAVTLTGSSFTNVTGATQYGSDVALTAADGSSVTLTPDLLDQGSVTVTIPGETAPGNYNLQAVKEGAAGNDVASNPAVISIKPQVIITEATGGSTVTINGSGFGGYAAGSGTSVSGTVTIRKGRKTKTMDAAIVSWSDTTIEADFGVGTLANEVSVNSVFGSDTAEVHRRVKVFRRRR